MKEKKVKFKAYDIIMRAVEEGVRLGWNRAHKHTDTPGEDIVMEQISLAISACLDEVIDFT